MQAPYELVREVAKTGKLPVVNFAAGGIATPADAALMMQLGMEFSNQETLSQEQRQLYKP
jgi:pyridoxal 5'-phosphate synthase pdxS subunit